MDGTVARVQVREMWADGVRPDHSRTGANVVADCTAVIEEVNVFEGVAAVKAGEIVRPGQVAISGVIEKKDGGFRWEYAAGEVWATVEVPLTVEIPLKTVETRLTGREKALHTLKIFKKTINLSLNYGIGYASYGTIDIIGQLYLPDGTPLPIWMETTTVRETEEVPVTLSADDAEARAKTEMRALIRGTTEDAQLLGKSMRGSLNGDTYRLDALLTVRRDIGRVAEFPVQTGDAEDSP